MKKILATGYYTEYVKDGIPVNFHTQTFSIHTTKLNTEMIKVHIIRAEEVKRGKKKRKV